MSVATTQQFLNALFAPDDHISLRPIETWKDENGRKRSRVLYKQTTSMLANLVTEATYLRDHFGVLAAEKANGFFGVCPRHSGNGGKYELAWQIQTVRCLWSDVDGATVEEILQRIKDAGLPEPSIIVFSGNGAHVYWLLTEDIQTGADTRGVFEEWVEIKGKRRPIQFIKDGDQNVYLSCPKTGKPIHANRPPLTEIAQRIQDTSQGIAAKIGGDHTQDLSRLLRLPGTLNRKNERNGDTPKPCVLVSCDPDKRYAFETFAEFAQKSPDRIRREKVARVPLPAVKRLTPGKEDNLSSRIVACDAAPAGTRSEMDFALCCFAIENGIARDEVWNRCCNVGKFGERGESYFDATWRKAEERTRLKIYDKASPPPEPESEPGAGDQPFGQSSGAGIGDFFSGHKDAENIDPPREAEAILEANFEDLSGAQTLQYWRDEFHIYRDGAYKRAEAGDLLQPVANHLEASFSGVGNSHINNVTTFLKSKSFLSGETDQNTWLDDSGRGPRIAVQNGLIDPETGQLENHSPHWFSPVMLPVKFDSEAQCPRWLQTLDTNLEGDDSRFKILQEFAGYMLWPKLTYQKYLTIVGEGGNGKSVYIAALQALLGRKNVSNYSLDYLGENRFAAAGTIGKLANLCADVSEINRFCEGVLKQLVTGDRMTVDRKNKPLIEVTPTAKLLFSANNLPRFTDRSSGMMRRMIIVPFNRVVQKHEIVRDMDKPFFWESELSGILNWALEGLARLRKQHGFTSSAVCDDAAEQYRQDNNPAAVFIEERLTVNEDPESYAVREAVYKEYQTWCDQHGRRPLGDSEFGREVSRAFPGTQQTRPRIDGIRKRAYQGLRLVHDPGPAYFH